jgi:hypothetical protein
MSISILVKGSGWLDTLLVEVGLAPYAVSIRTRDSDFLNLESLRHALSRYRLNT